MDQVPQLVDGLLEVVVVDLSLESTELVEDLGVHLPEEEMLQYQ
jgi:hypothetical protein